MLKRYRSWRIHRELIRTIGSPEIEVTIQCEHGCYRARSTTPVLWRFAGCAPVLAISPKAVMVHGTCCPKEQENGYCAAMCWDPEFTNA